MQDEKARNLDFESASAQTSQISLQETAQSDPESRPKIKSRSRFSSAIRKLSGSTRKKENSPQELAHETAAISSGGEDPEFAATTSAESKLKKKSRLSKRFLLSSLSKKSKISPKTSLDADDDNEERNAALDAFLEAEQGKQAENEKDNIVKEAKSKVAPISTSTSGKQTKVQITISGKKIDERLKTELKTGRTAAECLTTSEKTKQQSKQVSETFLESEAVKKAKKKLKAKKTLAISPTPTTTTLAASVSSTNADKPKDTTEKLVVTHSTSDTPPSERAPLKPFRSTSAGTAVSQTATGNETPTLTRKATTRAAVTLTTPSLTQRLIGSTTPKAKTQRANTLTTGETESKSDPINSATQRGQRLYRSTTLTSTPSTIHTTAPTVTSTAAGGTTAQAIKQRQLQFQLKSKSQSKNSASQSLTRKSENPNLPPLSSFSTTPAQETTTTGNSSGQDDIVSLAESAAYQADNETRPISQDLSDEAAEAALRIAARSIRKLGAIGSHESNFSSSSESQISHQHIIQYVSEPIMNDDFEIRNKSNDDFSLQTEATENTYETQMTAFGDLTMDAKMEPAIINTANAVKREHLYKILVIGEAGTGKTSFIKRYVHQFFSQNYRATIGVDFALKVLNWDDNTIVRLQLWDIAGQERFGNMTRVYYKEAVGVFIVFDVTRSNTFDCVLKWKQDLDSKVQLPDGSPIPCILLANKCDQEKQGIAAQSEKIDEYVKQNGFDDWFETSAKENINIEEAAKALISKILLNDKLITASDLSDGEVLNLMKAEQENLEAKSKCSC